MNKGQNNLTIGPILFHWPAEQKRDFYFKIADESPVDTVYIGEVVCSKRSPFFEEYYDNVTDRLTRAGKKVILSSLSEVMVTRERKMTEELAQNEIYEVEANDSSALYHLRGRRHRIGQYYNTYNEETLKHLVLNGTDDAGQPLKMKDGRPFAIFKNYTLSWSEKANLRLDLQSWRGKPFTQEEMQRFDLKNVLGAWCMLNIIERPGKNDNKMYTNVDGVTPVPSVS